MPEAQPGFPENALVKWNTGDTVKSSKGDFHEHRQQISAELLRLLSSDPTPWQKALVHGCGSAHGLGVHVHFRPAAGREVFLNAQTWLEIGGSVGEQQQACAGRHFWNQASASLFRPHVRITRVAHGYSSDQTRDGYNANLFSLLSSFTKKEFLRKLLSYLILSPTS